MLGIYAFAGPRQSWRMSTHARDEPTEAELIGRALAGLRKAAELSQEEAAKKFGLKGRAGWSRYERGEADSIEQGQVQRRLVAAIGATIEDLHRQLSVERSSVQPARGPGAPLPVAAANAYTQRMIPVYGLAAGQGERIALADGAAIRYVPMHPAQQGYARIGAAEVVGESMWPRWKPRELAYFVFDLTPPRGEDLIIELQDGTAMIKEYVGRTDIALKVREYYPHERVFDVPLRQVRAVHAVVG